MTKWRRTDNTMAKWRRQIIQWPNEEGQTTQCEPNEKEQKDKQPSTKHYTEN